MSEEASLLQQTANRVFAACVGRDLAGTHAHISESRLTGVMTEEFSGGGSCWELALPILFSAGEHALLYPIAESILAACILSASGMALPSGILSLAHSANGLVAAQEHDHLVFSGVLRQVAAGGDASAIAAVLQHDSVPYAVCFPRGEAKAMERHKNLADEPFADFVFEHARVPAAQTAWTTEKLYRAMALARVCQMSGAISAALSLSVGYTRQREQFGRPLATFQAIQQQLAVLAEEEAAARAAAASACRAADGGEASFEIAAAKLRANHAAAIAASIAHQVHGAIGFTREYALQKFTRRLWAWRSEYGNERRWAAELGSRAAHAGAEGFWPALVSGFAG